MNPTTHSADDTTTAIAKKAAAAIGIAATDLAAPSISGPKITWSQYLVKM